MTGGLRVDTFVVVTGARFRQQVAAASVIPWVAVVVLHATGARPTVGALGALTVLFGTAHIGTTAAFYVDPEARSTLTADRRRYFLVPVGLVALGLLVALGPHWLFTVAVFGLNLWSIHHLSRQNLGLFAYSCRSAGKPGPTAAERRLFDLTSWAGMFGIGQILLPEVPRLLLVVPGLVLLAAAGLIAARSERGAWLTLAVVFYAPLFVYHDLVTAALVYALAHGAQYEVMMLHTSGGRRSRGRMVGAVVGAFVLVGLPLHYAGTSGVLWLVGLQNGAFAAHFAFDARIWRTKYMADRFGFLSGGLVGERHHDLVRRSPRERGEMSSDLRPRAALAHVDFRRVELLDVDEAQGTGA